MKKTNIVTPLWDKCKEALESKDLESADELLMKLIYKLADYTMQGHKDSEKIEGVAIGVWKERSWMALQNVGLLPE